MSDSLNWKTYHEDGKQLKNNVLTSFSFLCASYNSL